MNRVLLLGAAMSLVGGVAFAETAGVPAPASTAPTLIAQGEPDDGSDDGDYSAAPESDWAEGSRDDWQGGPPHGWRGGNDNDGPRDWRGAHPWHWGNRDGRGPGWHGGQKARMMAGKGAHIVLQHRGNRIDVKCAADDSTADCVSAVERLMDKIAATMKREGPEEPPPVASPPPAPPANDEPPGAMQ